MTFWFTLRDILEVGAAEGLKAFTNDLDVEWITSALERHGAAKLRRRKLPGESAVWLVIEMAPLRDHSIAEVVRTVELVVPESGGNESPVVGLRPPEPRDSPGTFPTVAASSR